jgi:hypothetical protein
MGWLIVTIALMIPLVAIILDSHLGRALADYISRQGGPGQIAGNDIGTAKRLAALETEVERLNAELMRLEEETAFLHKLLEKPRDTGTHPAG